MRNLTAAGLIFLAACSPTGQKPKNDAQIRAEEQARAVFEKWREHIAQGEVDPHYDLFSAGFISKWLFMRLMSDDFDAKAWREGLEHGTPVRTDLDLWWEFCRKKYQYDDRPDTLPYRVILEPSLKDLYRKIFKSQSEEARLYARSITVETVAADPTGVTVMVKTDRGIPQGYGMTFERGAWKIDGFRENTKTVPR